MSGESTGTGQEAVPENQNNEKTKSEKKKGLSIFRLERLSEGFSKRVFKGKQRAESKHAEHRLSIPHKADESVLPTPSTNEELQSPQSQQLREAPGQEMETLPKKTGIWTRVKWTHHEKEDFKQKISTIRETLDGLEKLLALRAPDRPTRLFTSQSNTQPISHSTSQIQEALERLHNSLKKLNVQPPDGKPWDFAIHIATPFADNWKLIHDQYNLPLREGAQICYIQQVEDSEKSTGLLIETLTKSGRGSKQRTENLPQIGNLDDLPRITKGSQANPYKVCGSICDAEYPEEEHRVFADYSKWSRTSTLADMIDDPENVGHLSARNVVELTRLIMVAYLDFALVRQSCPNPRLENYVYYERDTKAQGMDDEGPLLLRPYLACKFGQKPPMRQPGATSGPSKDGDAPIIELGLVLFQIGSHRKLNYQTKARGGTVMTLNASKKDALASLCEIERHYGSELTRVIEVCLLSRAGNDSEAVEEGLSKLIELQKDLVEPAQIL